MTDSVDAPQLPPRVAFLGPSGTFGEEALRSVADLGEIDPIPMRTMPEALAAVQAEEVDFAFVALENSIEGTVNVSLDSLLFDNELYIQREVVMEVRLCLMAPKGVKLKDIKRVVSFPVAAAQCRQFLARKLPHSEIVASNSTSDAARQVSKTTSSQTAAVGTKLAAQIYDLQVIEEDISDHDGNQTQVCSGGQEAAFRHRPDTTRQASPFFNLLTNPETCTQFSASSLLETST